ncbi:FGGY family carbohydrate kinase, partial [Marinobacter sp.]|uniref:FGGY family carbohydrate kinase n=1 Tax=Marinobacter sp. TaxID=50741 RepID=UPI0035C6E019
IWESVVSTLKEVFNKCSLTPSDIAAVGITNQRETTLVWNKNTGEPVYPAIVWQDRRTAQLCRDLSEDEELVSHITESTGLLLDPYFSATKVEDIIGRAIPIQGVAGDQQAALVGQACFEKGMAKSTYGTGCFMILNTGDAPLQSKNRLLTTVGYRLNGKTTYALEGSI